MEKYLPYWKTPEREDIMLTAKDRDSGSKISELSTFPFEKIIGTRLI